MITADRVFAAGLFVLGGAYLVEAAKLPVWKDQTVGAGLFPMLLGAAMLVLTGASLTLDVLERGSAQHAREPFLPPRRALIRQASVLGALAMYVLALEPAGFIISTFLFITVLSIALDPARRISSVAVAVLLVALAQLLLVSLLKMPLPSGPFG